MRHPRHARALATAAGRRAVMRGRPPARLRVRARALRRWTPKGEPFPDLDPVLDRLTAELSTVEGAGWGFPCQTRRWLAEVTERQRGVDGLAEAEQAAVEAQERLPTHGAVRATLAERLAVLAIARGDGAHLLAAREAAWRTRSTVERLVGLVHAAAGAPRRGVGRRSRPAARREPLATARAGRSAAAAVHRLDDAVDLLRRGGSRAAWPGRRSTGASTPSWATSIAEPTGRPRSSGGLRRGAHPGRRRRPRRRRSRRRARPVSAPQRVPRRDCPPWPPSRRCCSGGGSRGGRHRRHLERSVPTSGHGRTTLPLATNRPMRPSPAFGFLGSLLQRIGTAVPFSDIRPGRSPPNSRQPLRGSSIRSRETWDGRFVFQPGASR